MDSKEQLNGCILEWSKLVFEITCTDHTHTNLTEGSFFSCQQELYCPLNTPITQAR